MGGGARGEPVAVVNQQKVEHAANITTSSRRSGGADETAGRLKRNESMGGMSDISKRPACCHVSVFVECSVIGKV